MMIREKYHELPALDTEFTWNSRVIGTPATIRITTVCSPGIRRRNISACSYAERSRSNDPWPADAADLCGWSPPWTFEERELQEPQDLGLTETDHRARHRDDSVRMPSLTLEAHMVNRARRRGNGNDLWLFSSHWHVRTRMHIDNYLLVCNVHIYKCNAAVCFPLCCRLNSLCVFASLSLFLFRVFRFCLSSLSSCPPVLLLVIGVGARIREWTNYTSVNAMIADYRRITSRSKYYWVCVKLSVL